MYYRLATLLLSLVFLPPFRVKNLLQIYYIDIIGVFCFVAVSHWNLWDLAITKMGAESCGLRRAAMLRERYGAAGDGRIVRG